MEEHYTRIINNLDNWEDLARFETNVSERGKLTPELTNAINVRSTELGRVLISRKTGLDLTNLSPAEEKIIEAVSEYVGILRKQKKYPGRTLDQLRNRGLLGAAEISVCKKTPTQGFQILAESELINLSYEKIVVDHPHEFSPRAVWYSRRTLQLPRYSFLGEIYDFSNINQVQE